jgi:hypothetical protein
VDVAQLGRLRAAGVEHEQDVSLAVWRDEHGRLARDAPDLVAGADRPLRVHVEVGRATALELLRARGEDSVLNRPQLLLKGVKRTGRASEPANTSNTVSRDELGNLHGHFFLRASRAI